MTVYYVLLFITLSNIIRSFYNFIRLNFQHEIKANNVSEEDVLVDFKLRERTRLNYPGACSLEYENIIQILIEDLFQWDSTKQRSKGKGVLGTVEAVAPADEEQGRGTLHSHWQIWLKEITRQLRQLLFAQKTMRNITQMEAKEIQEKARQTFYKYIDQLFQSRYEADFEVHHICKCTTNDQPNNKENSSEIIPDLIERTEESLFEIDGWDDQSQSSERYVNKNGNYYNIEPKQSQIMCKIYHSTISQQSFAMNNATGNNIELQSCQSNSTNGSLTSDGSSISSTSSGIESQKSTHSLSQR